MKKVSTIVVMMAISSTVFASEVSGLEGYDCGLRVGLSVAKLAGTLASNEINDLTQAIPAYTGDLALAATLKEGTEKNDILSAAHAEMETIASSLRKIRAVTVEGATVAAEIEKACGLPRFSN